MDEFRVKLELELDVEAFNQVDAQDVAADLIYEMEGLGVSVVYIRIIPNE